MKSIDGLCCDLTGLSINVTGPAGVQGPQGVQGPPGTNGTNGLNGQDATMSVGTVTTGDPGTNVIVTNSGTPSNAIWNFTIPGFNFEPALLSIKLGANVTMPNNTDVLLFSPSLQVDAATTARAFTVFGSNGENITSQPIRVFVTISVSYTGANTGTRALWIEVTGSGERYGYCQIEGSTTGNTLNTSCIILLGVGQAAAFWGRQTSNGNLDILGGTSNIATRWQSLLIF